MITIPDQKVTKSRPIFEIKNSKRGVVKLLREARVPKDAAVDATNMIQVEDGLYEPRWGNDYYGQDVGYAIDGAAEYLKDDMTTELLVVANGSLYKSTDGGAWTEVSGLGLTAGEQCYFLQISGYMYIVNGKDTMARYDGTEILTYNEISAPTGLSGTRTGSSVSGADTVYCIVTALNDVGETVASATASTTMDKNRDAWNPANEEGITWSWDSVSDANGYQVYIASQLGQEALVASVESNTWTDDGTKSINTYVVPPLSNTTTAPKFKDMCVSNNRIWATNDPENPYTVYFSGTGINMGVFSDFYGGGWINLEKGGREIPQKVIHYQSGSGAGIATVLCKTPEGRGGIWQISIGDLTVGDTTFSVPSASKIVGSFGTESIRSVVQTIKNVMFLNRKGAFSLGPKQNYFGILITEEESVNVRPYMKKLNNKNIKNAAGYFYDGKVFWSVPSAGGINNATIIWDVERRNWSLPWNVSATQFLEYTDTNGLSHFLYVPDGGTQLAELSESIDNDFGEAIYCNYLSGRFPLRKFWSEFARVDKVYINLGNPRGVVNLEVLGTGKNKAFLSLGTKVVSSTSTYSNSGFGWDILGTTFMGDTDGTPSAFGDSSVKKYIKIRKKLNDLQIRVTSNTLSSDYTILGIIVEGKPINTRAPSDWKN
jgi:hypothetical protein